MLSRSSLIDVGVDIELARQGVVRACDPSERVDLLLHAHRHPSNAGRSRRRFAKDETTSRHFASPVNRLPIAHRDTQASTARLVSGLKSDPCDGTRRDAFPGLAAQWRDVAPNSPTVAGAAPAFTGFPILRRRHDGASHRQAYTRRPRQETNRVDGFVDGAQQISWPPRASAATIASRPSVSAAGPGCRMSGDLISKMRPSRTAGMASQPRRRRIRSMATFLPHHEARITSGAAAMTASAETMRFFAAASRRSDRHSVLSARDLDQFRNPADAADERIVPFFEIDARSPRRRRGGRDRRETIVTAVLRAHPPFRPRRRARRACGSSRECRRGSRWLKTWTARPARIRSATMSACKSENAKTRSGSSARIFGISAEVKAETRGFSRRTCGGPTA